MGVLVGLVVGGLELWLGVGCGLGEVVELVGFGLGDEDLVVVGLGVGDAVLVVVGLAVGRSEELLLAVGVPLADVLSEAFAVPEALPELLGEPVGPSAESRRIAAFGRLEQAPFTIGEIAPIGRAIEAPKTSELDARSMNPVSAPSATGLTSCALIGTTSSWTS